MSSIPQREREIVRQLARQLADIASLPVQQQKADMWARHNDLERVRPMVLIFPEGAWSEVMKDWRLECSHELCRNLEQQFRTRLYAWDRLRDDNPVEAVVRVPTTVHNSGLGMDAQRTLADMDKGAYHVDPVLKTEADIEKIAIPEVTVDWEATGRRIQEFEELVGDILRIERTLGFDGHQGWAPMDQFILWRGIDAMFMDLMDRPQWVHAVMQRLLDARLAELQALEEQGALALNHRNNYNGSGGVGYTNQLPRPDFDGKAVRAVDLWGMATAQIFSEVSPAMHEEFALRYEKQFLEKFGLANYGCCEPLHNKIPALKAIPNLRRISISPWADLEKSAEQLQQDYVFSWKPNPAIIAAPTWNPEHVRRTLRDFCERTRGCITDIIMKDTHTCCQQPERLSEWVRIAMETAEEFADQA